MADFVISISYGNYLIQNGGTDKVIREHSELFLDQGIDYFFCFPVVRTVKIGKIDRIFRYWGINRNAEFIGLFNLEGVLNYIGYHISMDNTCLAVFVHHSWRILHDDLKRILEYVKAPIYYYLHDFYSICDGKNLLNQNGNYCGYGLEQFECDHSCIYYNASQVNKDNLLSLIKEFEKRLIFICPSDNTRDIYRATFREYKEKFITILHQELDGEYKRGLTKTPIKIAFIGKQDSLKGWDDYKNLLKKLSVSEDYEFYYLGTGTDNLANVIVERVSVREQGQDAMMNTLRKLGIDVVLLLSRCPETYSYTFFEAYAAGCFVITYECSGNIADMVKKVGNGIVVKNDSELIECFDKNTIKEKVSLFASSDVNAPLKLLPNKEIISRVKEGIRENQSDLNNRKKPKKKILADLIYRIQNRSKINAIKSKL